MFGVEKFRINKQTEMMSSLRLLILAWS